MATTRGDGRTVRAEARRERRREEILMAAAVVFAQRGYHAASVSDVIDAAEISRGTFYLYFDGKDALFLELMRSFTRQIVEVVRVVDADGPDPGAEIRANIRRVVDVVFDNRDLTLMVLREDIGLRPDVDEHLERFYGFVREMLEGALVNGAEHGLIRRVNERLVTTALIGAIKEVFLYHLLDDHTDKPDRDAVAESLVDFGVRGLLPQGLAI
ncbi:MAG: TetR/AcrR family transcriptional regulator [Myxococcales bacterium]|nr:TetR/AcrR family transcriptional regulator [Myxococcales bacterium]